MHKPKVTKTFSVDFGVDLMRDFDGVKTSEPPVWSQKTMGDVVDAIVKIKDKLKLNLDLKYSDGLDLVSDVKNPRLKDSPVLLAGFQKAVEGFSHILCGSRLGLMQHEDFLKELPEQSKKEFIDKMNDVADKEVFSSAKNILDTALNSKYFSKSIFTYPGFSIVNSRLTLALEDIAAKQSDVDVITPVSESLIPAMMAGSSRQSMVHEREKKVSLAIVGGKPGLANLLGNTAQIGVGLQSPGVILVINPNNRPHPDMPTHQNVHHSSLKLTRESIGALGDELRKQMGEIVDNDPQKNKEVDAVANDLEKKLKRAVADRTGVLGEVEINSIYDLDLLTEAFEESVKRGGLMVVHLPESIVDSRSGTLPELYDAPKEKNPQSVLDDISTDVIEGKKILFVLGAGVVSPTTSDSIKKISEKTNSILFATTMSSQGCIDIPTACDVGMIGTLGSETALNALDEADKVVFIGARSPDVMFGINVNEKIHLNLKNKAVQIVGDWTDKSPNVSEIAYMDPIKALDDLVDSIPEGVGVKFIYSGSPSVDVLTKGKLHPMVKALGDIMAKLKPKGVINEIGVGHMGIFQGGYALPSHDEVRFTSPDGSMNDIGRTLSLKGKQFIFLNIGDGDANMGLHQYLTEADSRARYEKDNNLLSSMPNYAVIIWDNQRLFNVTASEQRKLGHEVSGYSSGFEWGKIGDLYSSGEVESHTVENPEQLTEKLEKWSQDDERKKILVLHAKLKPTDMMPPIIATEKIIQ